MGFLPKRRVNRGKIEKYPYTASDIDNNSTVPGHSVREALQNLVGGGGAVTSVFGRVGAVIAVAGDYLASLITNDSSVAGATVKDALETLASDIAAGDTTNFSSIEYFVGHEDDFTFHKGHVVVHRHII